MQQLLIIFSLTISILLIHQCWSASVGGGSGSITVLNKGQRGRYSSGSSSSVSETHSTGQISSLSAILDDEERLIRDLLYRYSPNIPPVRHHHDAILLKFGLEIIQLINMYESLQIIKTNIWLHMKWHDYRLTWKSQDYGNIRSIRLPPDRVWTPDIVLLNNGDGNYEVSYKCNVVLYSNGTLLWVPPALYKSSCIMNVQYFPFDEQVCELRFGSWTYRSNGRLIYDWFDGCDRADLTDYVKSGTWDIIDGTGIIYNANNSIELAPGTTSIKETNSKMITKNTSEVVFRLKLRRKSLFYVINIVIPCVLISFLSMFVFYLPADAKGKMTLSLSVLLAHIVFMLLVTRLIPQTSVYVPALTRYLLLTFLLNIQAVACTIMIINLTFRSSLTHTPISSKFFNYLLFQGLPVILRMKNELKYRKEKKEQRYLERETLRILYVRLRKLHCRKWEKLKRQEHNLEMSRSKFRRSIDEGKQILYRLNKYCERDEEKEDNSKENENNSSNEFIDNRPKSCDIVNRYRINDGHLTKIEVKKNRFVKHSDYIPPDHYKLHYNNKEEISNKVPRSISVDERKINGINKQSIDPTTSRHMLETQWLLSQQEKQLSDIKHRLDSILLHRIAITTAKYTNFIANHVRKDIRSKEIQEDWRFIAHVISRLLLMTTFLVFSGGTVYYFLENPLLFKRFFYPILILIPKWRNNPANQYVFNAPPISVLSCHNIAQSFRRFDIGQPRIPGSTSVDIVHFPPNLPRFMLPTNELAISNKNFPQRPYEMVKNIRRPKFSDLEKDRFPFNLKKKNFIRNHSFTQSLSSPFIPINLIKNLKGDIGHRRVRPDFPLS
ncbi:hypothetical protein SNEBB_001313 [Seison nebaliae]|nr:hypothetical protein SNEBB_001313 [Seison nebaliae]